MRWSLCIFMVGAFGSLSLGDEGKGPQAGQRLPGPFPVFVVTSPINKTATDEVHHEERANLGDRARVGKYHDYVTRYGLTPTVAIFSHAAPPAADQPLAKLLKDLDDVIGKKRNSRLNAFAVFLGLKDEILKDDSRFAQVKAIEALAEQIKPQFIPMAIDRVESPRTSLYGIGRDTAVTVLVYDANQIVRARFDFGPDKPFDDAARQAILDEVFKMVGPVKQ